jgi:hypothetical protein
VAKSAQKGLQSNGNFIEASARGVRAKGDIGGYVWLPQWIGGRIRVNEMLKRC